VGNEVKGAVSVGKVRHEGKILLETSEVIFRGRDFRLRIALGQIQNVAAAGGELRIRTKDGLTIFEVGAAAEQWREKILHPKTRAEKLGMKAGTRVLLVGEFASDLAKDIAASKSELVRESSCADLTFFAAESKRNFAGLAKCAKAVKGAQALWIVYPKKRKEITELEVIAAGRKAGLKDVKVVGFSLTHTALKFVLPLGKR